MDDIRINTAAELAGKVIQVAQTTLLLNLRFMDTAIFRLTPKLSDTTLATDGRHIYYGAGFVLQRYKAEQTQVTRDMLHVILHCVFRHLFINSLVDKVIWNLAADIAVEEIINSLDLDCTDVKRVSEQEKVLSQLRGKLKLMSVTHLYNYYNSKNLPDEEIMRLSLLFASDDHSMWYNPTTPQKTDKKAKNKKENDKSDNSKDRVKDDDDNQSDRDKSDNGNEDGKSDNGRPQNDNTDNGNSSSDSKSSADETGDDYSESGGSGDDTDVDSRDGSSSDQSRTETAREWEDVSRQIQMDMETFSKEKGSKAGGMVAQLRELNRERYDYSAFLKKFAVMGEVMRINDDEFDYIFYTYGLQLYDNVPLIEPLEYKEVKRIREFVVAIDTSGSTSGELVQRFLEKTYSILKNTESFFSKINLHIIQCDAEIQEHVKIENQDEFDEYISHFEVKGMGGTDFRPVFREVDRMIREHEFTHLKGLIYFTDGYGEFPEKKPDYETAFVFIRTEYDDPQVPAWAIKLVLDKEEVTGNR